MSDPLDQKDGDHGGSAIARRHPVLIRAVAGVLSLALVSFVGLKIWSAPPVEKGVIEEWNDTILRLGIEPVFPPEEDIYVGDILALITVDRRPTSKDTRRQAMLNRAIKLDHIDMSEDLKSNYDGLPLFPDTEKRPDSPNDPWLLKNKKEGVFTGTSGRGSLAIAAFPGFTIRQQRSASGGFGGWAKSVFGGALEESDILEVKIPTAETYGVPSLLATYRLALYCQDPFTAKVCSDDTLRNHLSYVTPGMRATEIDAATGKLRYLVDVEIALVNRVYLTRSIEQTRRLGRSQAAALRTLADTATQQGKSETPPAGGADQSQAQKQTGAILKQLDSEIPGGLLSIYSGSDSSFELRQTFQRPIVIGYRAVRISFDYNLDRQNLTAGQSEQKSAAPAAGATAGGAK